MRHSRSNPGWVRSRGAALIAVLALGTLPTVAAAQPGREAPQDPQRDDVIRVLRLPDPRGEAWGAWLAERNGWREMIPLLQNVVSVRLASAGIADQAALDIALDALIQMDAKIPADLLQIVYERRPAQALILWARSGEDGDLPLIQLMSRERGLPWFAAADLALTRNSPGLGLALLRNMRFTTHIVVSEQGTAGVFEGGRRVGVGCGAVGAAPGLPPWPSYELTSFANPGVVVLAMGPTPIYYTRTVSPAGSTPAGHSLSIGGPTTDDRLRYIAALLRLEFSDLRLSADESHAVAWKGEESLQAAIAGARETAIRRYRTLVQRLIQASALTPADAAGLPDPDIQVIVRDRRMR